MLTLSIYLFGIADRLISLGFDFAFFGIMILVIALFIYCATSLVEEDTLLKEKKSPIAEKALLGIKLSICLIITGVILKVFVPDKETLATMIIVPEVVEVIQENEQIQKLPNNVLEFVNKWLENQTEKLNAGNL